MCSSVYPVYPEYPVCTQPAGASSNLQPFHLPPLLVVVNVIILSLSAMEIILFCCKGEGFEGKVSSISVFSPFKVPTHVRCACGCLTCKGVFGCFSRSRFAGAYFKIERFRLKLWILTLIPGKMNAVSVPSPSHFVKHLSPLWHTCTLPQQFAHCETLDNTVAQMHTSLHTTSKLHTL